LLQQIKRAAVATTAIAALSLGAPPGRGVADSQMVLSRI
jgi:hypothetical protein